MKELKDKMENGKAKETTLDADGAIIEEGTIFVPRVYRFIQKLLVESHCSQYSIFPSVNKIYRDLKRIYWW